MGTVHDDSYYSITEREVKSTESYNERLYSVCSTSVFQAAFVTRPANIPAVNKVSHLGFHYHPAVNDNKHTH
jgi:hypothetical protein